MTPPIAQRTIPSVPRWPARRLAAGAWRALEGRAAWAHVAGPELEQALAVAARAGDHGLAVTIGYWNDDRDTPTAVHARCSAAAEALRQRPNAYLSCKPPALAFDAERVRALAGCGVPVHFDSLAPADADRSFTLAEQVAAGGTCPGLTLPGRWHRSPRDAERALALGARVRVVKGQWVDPDDPALDPRAGCLRVIERLAGAAVPVAVASHDARLVDAALTRLLRAGTAAELEVLLGHPRRRAVAVARRYGVPVRLYVPYGRPWLPWSVADVRRRPWLLARIARSALAAGVR